MLHGDLKVAEPYERMMQFKLSREKRDCELETA